MRRSMILATATLAGAALWAPSAPAQTAKVGKTLEYTFQTAPDNGFGVTSLESFKGKPTLFEFWATY